MFIFFDVVWSENASAHCPFLELDCSWKTGIGANVLVLSISFVSPFPKYLTAQGLLAKTAKDGALSPVPLLVTPERHLHVGAVTQASRSIWTWIRAKGMASTAAFVVTCSVVVLWALVDEITPYFPGATDRVLGLIYSVPGGAFGYTALQLLSGGASNVVRALNPFDGARDALRLHPVKVSVPPPLFSFLVLLRRFQSMCGLSSTFVGSTRGATCFSLVLGVAGAVRCVVFAVDEHAIRASIFDVYATQGWPLTLSLCLLIFSTAHCSKSDSALFCRQSWLYRRWDVLEEQHHGVTGYSIFGVPLALATNPFRWYVPAPSCFFCRESWLSTFSVRVG